MSTPNEVNPSNCNLPDDGLDDNLPVDSATNALIGQVQPDGLPCWGDGAQDTHADSSVCNNCGFHKP